MKTLKSLDQVLELVASQRIAGHVVYARYSKGPAVDARYGNVSRNHQTGECHAGLSANALTREDIGERGQTREWVAQQLAEYAYLLVGQTGSRCWLLTGNVIGEGADGEPVLANIAPLAAVAAEAMAEAHTLYLAEEDRRNRERNAWRYR